MIDFIKESITLYIIFPVIVLIGGYLTYRLRFLQLTQLSRAFHMIKAQKKSRGDFII